MKTKSISFKLLGAFGAILTLTLVLGGLSIWTVQDLKERLNRTSHVTVKKTLLAGEIEATGRTMLAAQRGLIMNTFGGRFDNLAQLGRGFTEAADQQTRALQTIEPLLFLEEGKRLTKEMRELSGRWRSAFADIQRVCEAHRAAEAMIASDKTVQIQSALVKAAEDLARLNVGVIQKDNTDAEASTSRALIITIVMLCLAVAAGAAGLFMVRKTVKGLESLAGSMIESAEQVASASGQVAGASQALAQGASEQAASLEETSASAEEITSMTRKNADNSREAAELMTQVDNHVMTGNSTLSSMVTSMQSINESSQKVSKIIKVIDEIAFQTNILALNAAVEAARAGDAGMGFAVVADEVRNLAQRSAQAAKDTSSLIEESISRSKEGSGKLEDVAGVIRSITDSATKVKTLVDEVSLGSQEQSRGIEQIAKAIAQMDQVTQQNAASAEESASASEELTAQSEAMRGSARQLQEMITGKQEHHERSFQPVRAKSQPRAQLKAAAPLRRSQKVAHSSVSQAEQEFPLDDFRNF